jgi:hypothetical protein
MLRFNKFSITLVVLLGLALHCCSGQSQTGLLETTTVNVVPFCNVQNTSYPNTTSICSDREQPLKCKILLNQATGREFVALVHGKGIAFYHVDAVTHTTQLVAQYQSDCLTLKVVGLWRNLVFVSSSLPVNSTQTCPALGLGTIDTTQWGTGNATVIDVQVTPNTLLFSYAEEILSSKDQGNTSSSLDWFLAVFGATQANQTGTSQDLLLKSPGTTSTDNTTAENPTFEVLFQNTSFPFQLLPRWSFLFNKLASGPSGNTTAQEGNSLWIVGPSRAASTGETSSEIQIWSLLASQSNDTSGNVSSSIFQPSRIAVIPVNEGKYVGISPRGEVLYASQLESGANQTTGDMLTVFDITNLQAIRIAGNITYQQLKQGVGAGSSNVTTGEVPKITALKAGGRLWSGWNTGELFVHTISVDPLNPTLEFYGDIFTLTQQNTSGSTSNGVKGINDICPYVIGPQARSFVTANPANENGKLFVAVGPQGEQQPGGTSTAETASVPGTATTATTPTPSVPGTSTTPTPSV